MSNRKELYYMLSITIMIFLTVVFAVTFSYVGRANVTRNTNTNIAILGNASFSYTGVTTLSLNVTEANLASNAVSNTYNKYVRSSLRNTNITLTSDPDQFPSGLTCNYDIVYTPTVAFEKSPAAVAAGLKEMAVEGLLDGTSTFNTEIYGSNETILYSGSISTSADYAAILQKWRFRVYFYNLNVDQNNAAGQNPKGVISIRNGECHGNTLYWFDTSTCTSSSPCTFPTYGGTLKTSGSATGHNVYIKQDGSKYYTCGSDGNGHEACFSQPYTQYGLEGYTMGVPLTSEQRTSVEQALTQVINDAGMSVAVCQTFDNGGYCAQTIPGFSCDVETYMGRVMCTASSPEKIRCAVKYDGSAYCETWSG